MKSWRISVCLQITSTFILLFSLIAPVKSAPGDLDLSFGNNGKRIVSFTSATDWIEDIALQADGKIVAVGLIGFEPGVAKKFGVARFNTNGSLDTTFGIGGSVTTSFNTQYAWAYGVALQSDGKIVVCGGAYVPGNSFVVAARYLSNGSLDPDFSEDGKVETPVGTYDDGYDIAVQPNGKIVLTGVSDGNILVLRYTSSGTLDRRMKLGGKTITPIAGTVSGQGLAIKMQPDGKTIVAGSTETVDAGGHHFLFATIRYNNNGMIDKTFDVDGIQTETFGQSYNNAHDLAVQPDGKIVVVGYTNANSQNVFSMVRYNPDGSRDTLFGTNGGWVMTHPGGYEGVAFAVAIQPDGKILVGGSVRNAVAPNHYSDFMLMRYTANGLLDTDFGIGGKVTTGMGVHNDQINAIAIQPDGRIVVGGFAIDEADNSDFGLARFLAE